MNWDDLRIAAAIGRAGTLAAAARRLGIDQTTVARRLRALEDALGTPLFERGEGGWQPTAPGSEVLARAWRMEEDAADITRIADAGARSVSGRVHLTSVGPIVADYLAPRLASLMITYPALDVDLIARNDNLSLARREADIALRLGRPADGDFLIRKLADVGFAVYAPADTPIDPVAWVAYGEDLDHTPEMRWLAARLNGPAGNTAARIRLRCDSLRGLTRAIAAGIGCGVLPCFIGDACSDLRRVPTDALPVRELWQLVHRDARRLERVDAVSTWLAERFAADADLFRGLHPPA